MLRFFYAATSRKKFYMKVYLSSINWNNPNHSPPLPPFHLQLDTQRPDGRTMFRKSIFLLCQVQCFLHIKYNAGKRK